MQALIILFLHGSASLVSVTSKANQDTWLTILFASAMTIPMIFLYSAILKRYPQKNLFEIIVEAFGKIIGKIVCILYIWYAIHLGSMILRMFSELMHLLTLSETPQIMIAMFMILPCIWLAASGIENMGRLAKLCFWVVTIFILTTTVVAIKDMNFSNIKPVLTTDAKTLISSSFPTFMLPFGELILMTVLFPFVKPQNSPTKIYIKALVISTTLFVALNLRNLFVLGLPSTKMFYLASYQAVSVLSIGEFFTRMEVLVGAIVLISCFIKICLCLVISSTGLANVCGIKENKRLVAPSALIMVILAACLYTKTEEMFKWVNFYMIYAIPFELILPIIIWITAEIKTRIKKDAVVPEPENVGSLE